MQVGGPIDNIIIDSYKFIGKEPTQEEIDELKNKYQGDTEKAMNDFYSVLKTYTNETPDLRKKVALKSYYKVPLNFAETMALSENTSLNPAEENRTTKAKGYFQIIERWHKDDIQNIYGKDFQTAMQDPSIQEDYMYKYLVPSYEKRIPNLKKLFNEGYEKGVLNEYKPFMIGGRFTDDQLKAIQHVLGPTGAANLLATGQTVDEGQKRDVQRALSKMVSLRKQYGVPTFLSNQYDFDKFGIGDILPYDILAAGEDKVEETPAPKTVPYQQAPLAPGRKKVDLISPFLPKQEPKAEEEPKPKPKPIKERYGYSWEQGQTVAPKTIEPPKPASYAITETPVTKRENLIKSEGVKKQEFVESTAALKELEERNTYENYKEKPIDFENLTPEVIQARDEIQQVVANQNKRLSSSEALLRIQFGDTVTRDIQDVLANNANYTKTINNLEEKLKGKYGNNTPAKIDFGPLAEQNNEISENIKAIGTQINGIDSQLDAIQKKLDELDNDPNITPARYNVLNANLVLEYNGLVGQKNELIEKGKTLEKDLEDVVAQQNVIINDYNKRAKAEFASDPDVQELNRTYEKYKQNWDKINNYKKSPYFDSYLDSISTLSELDPIYKNLFPDKMRGEQRSKQLAKLAQDIVTEKKTDSYLLNEALIGFYDIYNGVKSLFTDAPAVGYTSIGMNALKGATFNLVGDILASAATISDFAGAEKLGRELRAGDLFGFTVTGAGIEQDVARGAVRSDIAGNPVENYYTVKENDTQLFGIGLTPGDKIIVEDGSPILYRDKNDFKINLFTLPGKNPTLIVKDFLKGKENQIEEDFSIARTVVSALPSAVDMISLIGFNAAAIPRLSKFIASKGLRTAAGMTLNFGAQTFQQYGDLYKSYLDEGKSAQKAAKFALGQSAGVALIELLNPLEMKVASIGGDAAVSQFRKVLDTTVDLYSRGQIGLLDTINAIATGFVATTGAEISKETITELFQGAFENQVQNYASNENKSYTLNEAENTAWTTVAITTIPSFFLGAASYRTAKADIITSAIYNATKDPAKFEADTLKALKDGKMDIPDSASIFNFVGYIKEELDTYENLTDEQGAALSGLIGTRYSLENKKKNSNNEVVKKKIDEQIQEINTTIEEVAKGNKKVEVDPFVKPFYEEEGQPEADRVPTKKEFSDVVYATMPKEWQDMSKEEAWKSFQELPVQDQIKFFNTATGKKEEVTAPSPTAAGLTKEQQTELDKVNKRVERIQRTLQEDTAVQEEGDEPLLTAEQKKILETELQTLNQRRDAIQKQSTAAVPVQSGAEGRQGVGGQVQAKPEGPTRKGEEAKAEGEKTRKVTNVSIEPPVDEDGEVDYEAEDAVRQIAKSRNLGITRDREIASVARDENGNIVGGAFTSYDDATGEYTFDVVVSEDYDGTGIGSKLLDSVINLPSDIKDINPKAKVKVDVVNPRMKNMLEQRGFKVTKKIGDDRFIMEPSKKAPQATKAAAPTPTPTTTEKVSQKAAEAPQKANTVQGVELTKADGTKTAPAEYRKNPNTGKWGRVNAKGGITPVSSPAQVKQLEDALASQTKAAAETKKTEPTPTEVAETPIPKNKVRASFNIENAGRLKTIQTTPAFKNIFSEEQLKNLKVGENTVDLNMTAWGKAQRMLDAKDVTKKTEPTPTAAVQTSKAQRIIDEQKKATQLSKEISKKIKDIMSLSKSMFNRFGVKTRVVDKKTLQKEIRAKFKDLAFSRTGAPVIPATKPEGKISEKDFKDLKNLADELGFTLSATRNKTYAVYLDNLTGTIYYNTEADITNPVKNLQDLYGADSVADLKNKLEDILPEGIELMNLQDNKSSFYIAIPDLDIIQNYKDLVNFDRLSEILFEDPKNLDRDLEIIRKYASDFDWFQLSYNPNLNPTPEMLREFKDEWNWYGISSNPSLKSTPEMLREFKDEWHWDRLSRYQNIDLEMLKEFKDEWSWGNLSQNPSLNPTPEMLREFKDEWNWSGISYNPNLNPTPEMLREFKDKWDWYGISSNPSLNPSLGLLKEFKDEWIWGYLSRNPSLNPTVEMLKEFKDEWIWGYLSGNPSLNSTFKLISKFRDKWDWYSISSNPSLNPTPEMLREFKDEWNWSGISYNPNLNPTPEMLREFKDKWDWYGISSNPSLNPTPEMLREFKNKWDWYDISFNPSLNPTPEMLREFKDEWHWSSLSRNPSLNPSLGLLKEFKDEWDWGGISDNPSLNPTIEMLREFKDELDWSGISGHKNFNITKEIANEFKNYIDWTEVSRQNKLKPWHLDYVGINVKSTNKAKFTKLSSVGLPAESVRHYFPLFTGKSPKQIINYWADTWKSGLTTVESATTNPDLINSDVKNDYKGGGFVVFSDDSNFLFYSPEDNYSIPTETKKTKGPKNLKYATRSTAMINPSMIREEILGMDQYRAGRDEWIIELSPANIDYIQFNLKEDNVKIRELTSNGKNVWEELGGEVNSFAINTFVSYLENYTSDKETFLFALEDLGMDAFDKRHPQYKDGKKVYQYLRDLVINNKIDNFSGNTKVPDFLQNLNDEFGIEIRVTSPDGKKTTTLPRKTINTFLSKSEGEVWGFYDNKLKEAVLRSDAPMEATVHEAFTHPFLEAAKVQNPKLYNSLLKQAAAKKEIKESVDKDYKDKTRAERNDEYIARAIDKYVKGELDAIKDKGLIKAILDFFKNISDNLKSFLDLPTSVKDISPNTTLKELAQYSLYGKGTIDLTTQPTPSAAETKAPEAQTATAETVLEPIGKTSAEREKQIEKFFTAAAGKDKAESSQMAKLTNNIWNSVAKFFGARNAQTANQWIQSKVALIGKTTTTEAGKLGTPRFQGDTDNPYTFAEAAEAVANNLITEIDRMIKERSNLANIKKRGFTKSQAAAQVRDLRKIKEDLLQAKKDPKWQVDAYHGTPYVFDKFSTEKIGTGEGAQAFGWGLYFTDLESIARDYATKIPTRDRKRKGIRLPRPEYIGKKMKEVIDGINIPNQQDFQGILADEKNRVNNEINKTTDVEYQIDLEDYLKSLDKIKTVEDLGIIRNLYKTSLFKGKKPGDYTFLEWDKPLTKEQKRRIAEQGIKEGITSLAYLNENGVPTLNTSNEITAEFYYKELQKSFLLGSPKEASLFLLRAGIDGIKYPAESISRGVTADTARGFNYVIFDENDVTIEERVQFQQDAAKFRAAVITTAQNKLIVAALESPNASSFVHEGFHMFEGDLTAAEKQTIIDSYNDSFGEKETEFTTDVSEWGARMWEKYFSNGRQLTAAEVKDTKKRKALQEIFDNFTEWLKGVYEGVINYTNTKGVTKEVNIAPEVQALFDNIMGITTTPTPTAAETQVEAEAKTAEELSADIEADIEAAAAKEQEAMAKAFEGNKKQKAANDLIKNPKSVDALPQDLLEDLYNLAAEAKYTPALKKKCD